MSTDLSGFDVSPWLGRTKRTRVRATRETVELLETSLDRALPGADATLAPLRHRPRVRYTRRRARRKPARRPAS